MSFCCGASMIGAVGTIKSEQVVVHQVPLVFCPVCHQVDVHFAMKEEFELLVDYARGDGAQHVNFVEYVEYGDTKPMMENCISVEGTNPEQLYREQIDNALDLLSAAKQLRDNEWENVLKERLKVLSRRLQRFRQRENV